MEIERIEKPLYSYKFTAEEITNLKGASAVIARVLDIQPMVDDGAIVFEGVDDMEIEQLDCHRAIEFLNKLLDGEGVEFY